MGALSLQHSNVALQAVKAKQYLDELHKVAENLYKLLAVPFDQLSKQSNKRISKQTAILQLLSDFKQETTGLLFASNNLHFNNYNHARSIVRNMLSNRVFTNHFRLDTDTAKALLQKTKTLLEELNGLIPHNQHAQQED